MTRGIWFIAKWNLINVHFSMLINFAEPLKSDANLNNLNILPLLLTRPSRLGESKKTGVGAVHCTVLSNETFHRESFGEAWQLTFLQTGPLEFPECVTHLITVNYFSKAPRKLLVCLTYN